MGLATAAIIGGAASLFGASQQAKAAKKAAQAQQEAADEAVAEQRRQYDLTRQDQMPFLQHGYDAIGRQTAALNGDFSGFQNSPDYAYAREQMIEGLDAGAAARGRLYSGGYGVDMASHLNGLANQNYGNYWNRLAGMAGQGQVSANALGSFGQNSANNIGNLLMQAGDARASSYQQQGQAWGGAINSLGTLGMWAAGGMGGSGGYKIPGSVNPWKG